MGCDFHITRALKWTDSESVPIRLDEWKAYVASNPEFRMDNFAEVTIPQGATLRYDNEGLTVWAASSGGRQNCNMVWFDYRSGRIVVKNADNKVREKMKEIASFFGARVVGDEGEEY